MAEGSDASPPGTTAAKPPRFARTRALWRRFCQRISQTRTVTRISVGIAIAAGTAFWLGITWPGPVRDSPHWNYWLQVVTSNWSPEQPKKPGSDDKEKAKPKVSDDYIGDTEYIAGVVVALVINLGSFVLIFGTLRDVWIAERRKRMKTSKVYEYRDLGIQSNLLMYILNNFAPNLKDGKHQDQIAKIFNDIGGVFAQANEGLPKDIEAGFGDEGREYLQKHRDDLIRIINEGSAVEAGPH